MYFVFGDGRYVDVAGRSFRDFLDRRIPELKNVTPTMSDWADHLTTIFPEARLKQFLEMRGADGGTWRRICGLPALWAGIYYDQVALDAAWDLVKDWTAEERQQLRDSVPHLAFKTPFRRRTVRELAREMLAISADGLKRRAQPGSVGPRGEGEPVRAAAVWGGGTGMGGGGGKRDCGLRGGSWSREASREPRNSSAATTPNGIAI